MTRHWTDAWEEQQDDSSGALVRPYTLTGGRTAPERDDLTMITVMTTVPEESAPRGSGRGLQPEHRAILALCRTPAAVAEVAACMGMPLSVAKILLGDLLAAGRVTARAPLAVVHADGRPDTGLLEAVRDGLRRL